MKRIASLHLGTLTALCALGGVAVVLAVSGQEMFSPGPLNAESRTKVARGGVASHADIASCSPCHASPLSSESMASRCADCHQNVKEQVQGHKSMHGMLEGGDQCMNCHTEHKGSHGVLTSLTSFNHDCTGYKLTGKHMSVACASCHKDTSYSSTPSSCVACHAEPAHHKNQFGTNCNACHTTDRWEGSTITHVFPFNHGGNRKAKDCATCHSDLNHFTTGTCYGCHEHQQAREQNRPAHKGIALADLNQNCATCHPTGRGPIRKKLAEAPPPPNMFGAANALQLAELSCPMMPRGSGVLTMTKWLTMKPLPLEFDARPEATTSASKLVQVEAFGEDLSALGDSPRSRMVPAPQLFRNDLLALHAR